MESKRRSKKAPIEPPTYANVPKSPRTNEDTQDMKFGEGAMLMKTPSPPRASRMPRSAMTSVSGPPYENLGAGPSYGKKTNKTVLSINVESSRSYLSYINQVPTPPKKQY